MKKALSVLLCAVLMLSALGCCFGVFAQDNVTVCTCEDCTKIPNGCHCCAYCEYLDLTYLNSCAKDENGHFKGSFCCGECNGIWPDCGCECECCQKNDVVVDDDDPILPKPIGDNIVIVFQNVLKRISDVLDMLFGAVFEFLRLDEFFAGLGQ